MQKKSDLIGKGLVVSLILMVVDLIGGFAQLRFESWFRGLPVGILVIAVILLCIQYGKEGIEDTTYGKVFGYGFKITLLIALFMFIYTLLSLFIIFPELKEMVLQKTRTDMEAKGTYSQDVIDSAVNMTKKFFVPFALIGGILATVLFGVIGSLLGAAFAKKTEANVFQNNP